MGPGWIVSGLTGPSGKSVGPSSEMGEIKQDTLVGNDVVIEKLG
jgi:hypothetical protein